MPFDLNRFRNALVHGGARPSQFEMEITWPTNIPTGLAAGSALRFLCQVAELPGTKIGNVKIPYFGRKLNYAGDRDFDEFTIRVINDEDMKIRHAFEDWMRAITGHSTVVSQFTGGISTDLGGLSYATEGIVTQLSRNENGNGPSNAYRFVGMWPMTLEKIDLDWSKTDEIEQFGVTFAYQWWDYVPNLNVNFAQ
jgi:hypothetical protein